MTSRLKSLLVLATAIAVVGFISVIAHAATNDEQTIRDLDKAWSQAAETRDAAKCASFYSDTASALPFNSPIATGKEKILELWTQLMAKPGFSLHFAPTKIEVSKSKDVAYDVGTFALTLNDAQGTPSMIPGKYVVVWKKQKSGEWKAEADIFNTDK